jgi:hypothetical protein
VTKNEMAPILTSAAMLWKSLSVDKTRDRELEKALKNRFRCPVRRSLHAWLKQHEISAEEFLINLLESAGPYVRMWEGILEMFELANARRSRRNLLISFEFFALSKLQTDLSHFKAHFASTPPNSYGAPSDSTRRRRRISVTR